MRVILHANQRVLYTPVVVIMGKQLVLELSKTKKYRAAPCTFIILFFILSISGVNGQDKLRNYYLRDQKQISAEFLGISYRDERILRPRISHTFHSSLQYSLMLTSGNTYDRYMYSVDMIFYSGVRYYYKISNKSAILDQNIGQYVQVNVGIKPGSISSKGLHYPLLVYISPNWGVRLGLSKKWNMEFIAGPLIGSNLSRNGGTIGVSSNLEFRVGRLIGNMKK